MNRIALADNHLLVLMDVDAALLGLRAQLAAVEGVPDMVGLAVSDGNLDGTLVVQKVLQLV